ncbi:hypothetical protein X734_32480 [Mesorhizobium sp. L2C084A000]|nr:hypothetical protein X734_32480 [Mesorhizobium sp. L2C084A000]
MWPLWRQDEEVDALVAACLFELAMNSAPPSTWMPVTFKDNG